MAGLSYASDQPHIFVAVANSISEGGVDIFHLPSQRRVSKIPPDPAVKTGMLMAVDMVLTPSRQLCVASGYEEGTAMVHVQTGDLTADAQLLMSRREWTWEKIYGARAHLSPDEEVVRQQQHDSIAHKPLKLINTKHAGQQSLQTRSDGKLFATAGWDQRVRVYANASMKELAVLKWHREGCFAVAFAEPDSEPMLDSTPENGKRSDAGVAEPRARLGGAGPKFSGRESEGSHAANTAVTAFPQAQLHGGIAAVRTRRSIKALSTHWLAAAGKDHKITLWDVY
ncbi:ASTRA complex subunit [Ascosphaera acerosa]|nr:ASTRA complex subunit [Ascosphaera acerosa]